MENENWTGYRESQSSRGLWVGCCLLLLAFILGAFFGVVAIWTYQELGFRS